MKKLLGYLFALLALVGVAHAEDVCYEFLGQGPYSSIRTNTGQAFCDAAIGMLGAPHELGACTGVTGPALDPSGTVTATVTYMGSFNSYAVAFVGPLPIDCPPPDGCDLDACPVGTQISPTAGANEVCNQDCGCKLMKTGSAGGTTSYHNTGEPCDPSDEDAPDDTGPDEGCTAVGDGEYCASPDGDGDCGYFNDSYICLNDIADDECKALGDGGRVCSDKVGTTPPVPDSGTPGDKAPPDGHIDYQETPPTGPPPPPKGFDYYDAGTVAGSSRDPGTTGSQAQGGSPHGGPNGNGTQGGASGQGGGGNPMNGQDPEAPENEGEGQCEDGACQAGAIGDLDDIGTMTEAFTGFWNDLQDVPIIAAGANIAPSFSGGACPAWQTSVALYSASIDIDFTNICGLWTSISSTLTFVCLVVFGFLAFRILFSA